MNDSGGLSHPNILLVKDDAILAQTYLEFLHDEPRVASHPTIVAAAIDALEIEKPKVVLLDLLLPKSGSLDVLDYIKRNESPISIIVMTPEGSINNAGDAIRAGALEFLVKPVDAAQFKATFKNALERQSLRRKIDAYEGAAGQFRFHQRLPVYAKRLPRHRQCSRQRRDGLHYRGKRYRQGNLRGGRSLIKSAARPNPGHRQLCRDPQSTHGKRNFWSRERRVTVATSNRKGAAARADGGTLFFDEIAEKDMTLQAKLLRFVQIDVYQRVGDDHTNRPDVRLVCVTNRNPAEEVEAGWFRKDLYYRLHDVPIELPPLRIRNRDVIAIGNHMLNRFAVEEKKRFTAFSSEVKVLFQSYNSPSNVRQLQSTIRNIVVLYDGTVVTCDMLPDTLKNLPISGASAVPCDLASPSIAPLWLTEKRTIEGAIKLYSGNIPKAVKLLDISNLTIYRKRRDWAEREQEL